MLFLGAGASCEFGVPSMKELTRVVENALSSEGVGGVVPKLREALSAEVDNGFRFYEKDEIDIEAIMSAVAALKRGLTRDLLPEIGAVGAYLVGVRSGKVAILENLDKVETICRNAILQACGGKAGEESYKVYSQLWNQLIGFNSGDGFWSVVTTNYDIAYESFWYRFRKQNQKQYGDIRRGFDRNENPSLLSLDQLRQLMPSVGSPILLKLHGSVDWWQNTSGEIVERAEKTADSLLETYAAQMLIYPTGEKYITASPFFELYARFRYLLAEPGAKKLVVIGYSFRDAAIRNAIAEAWAKAPGDRTLIIIDPNADEIAERLKDVQRPGIVVKPYRLTLGQFIDPRFDWVKKALQ